MFAQVTQHAAAVGTDGPANAGSIVCVCEAEAKSRCTDSVSMQVWQIYCFRALDTELCSVTVVCVLLCALFLHTLQASEISCVGRHWRRRPHSSYHGLGARLRASSGGRAAIAPYFSPIKSQAKPTSPSTWLICDGLPMVYGQQADSSNLLLKAHVLPAWLRLY